MMNDGSWWWCFCSVPHLLALVHLRSARKGRHIMSTYWYCWFAPHTITPHLIIHLFVRRFILSLAQLFFQDPASAPYVKWLQCSQKFSCGLIQNPSRFAFQVPGTNHHDLSQGKWRPPPSPDEVPGVGDLPSRFSLLEYIPLLLAMLGRFKQAHKPHGRSISIHSMRWLKEGKKDRNLIILWVFKTRLCWSGGEGKLRDTCSPVLLYGKWE